MGIGTSCPALVGVLLLAANLAVVAGSARGKESEEGLLARIEREQNPVKKTKLKIRLARLKLSQASEAYLDGEFAEGQRLLEAYLACMQSAWQVMRNSKRRATKSPQGFKELEIALREDGRLLEDLQHRVPYFHRAPVETMTKEVEGIRTEVIRALFGLSQPSVAKQKD